MATLWRKTKSGVWYITYRVNGKQVARSLRTRSKREAVRLRQEIEALLSERKPVSLRVAEAEDSEARNPRCGEFWESFSAWALVHRLRSVLEGYEVWFHQLVEYTGARRLGDISRRDIESFKAKLLRQGKRKPEGVGLDPVSINGALKTLQAIWGHAIRLGLYTGENPVAGVERLRTPERLDQTYLDKEQVEALLDAALGYGETKYVKRIEARNVYLAIALMAYAGLRRREACYARWEWIDWANRVIKVQNDGGFSTKNRKPRIISMHSRLGEILAAHRQEAGYILESTRAGEEKTAYRADFKKAFQQVCESAGIRTTPHQLRHSFATRHAIAGTSLHVLAGWLGHSTTWVTQRYAHFQTTYNAAADNI